MSHSTGLKCLPTLHEVAYGPESGQLRSGWGKSLLIIMRLNVIVDQRRSVSRSWPASACQPFPQYLAIFHTRTSKPQAGRRGILGRYTMVGFGADMLSEQARRSY